MAPSGPVRLDPNDLDETVRRFIKRYGDRALAEARRRVDELDAEGDHDGAATWRRLAAAIAAQGLGGKDGKVH